MVATVDQFAVLGDQQPGLLRRIAQWLRPGGWLLATVGQDAWTGTENNWLGGPATMWWSQADAATYRSWLQQAGLQIVDQDFIAEGDSGHALFWARRPSGSTEPKGQTLTECRRAEGRRSRE